MPNFIDSPNVYTSPATGDGYTVVHTGACHLLGLVVENQTGSTLWCQVHDGYATPANDSVPVVSLRLTANAQQIVLLQPHQAINLATGMTICSSSTGKKLTLGAPTDLFLSVIWV